MTTVLPSQPPSLTLFTTGRRGVLARACARTSDGRAQIHALRRVLEPPFTSYGRERTAVTRGRATETRALRYSWRCNKRALLTIIQEYVL